MANNTTLIGVVEKQAMTDDSIGAMIFIVFVLLWYSSSIFFLMLMQSGRSNGILGDRTDRSSKFFVEYFRDQTNHKEILGKTRMMKFHLIFSFV